MYICANLITQFAWCNVWMYHRSHLCFVPRRSLLNVPATEDMTNYYTALLREPALFSACNLAYRSTFKQSSFAECQRQVQTAAGNRFDVRKWNDHKNSICTYLCVTYTCSLCPKRATAWSSNCFKRKHRNITSAQDQKDERWWHSDYLSTDINGIWCKLWRFSGNEHKTQPMC